MARNLLVFVPGLGGQKNRSQFLDRVAQRLGNDWQLVVYDHRLRPASVGDLDTYVADLAASVRYWAQDGESAEVIEKIVLVGHSIGGLLARGAYLRDSGLVDDDVAVRGDPQLWTSKVERIVLLGSPNSGFRRASMPWHWRMVYAIATPFADYVVEQIESGGYWLTNLRLRWVNAMRELQGSAPRIIQILGTKDGLVGEEDIIDSEYMSNTVRIDVPGADHLGLVDLSQDSARRLDLIVKGIEGSPAEVTRVPETQRQGPTYFLLHGIRSGAYADWVPRLSRAIVEASDEQPLTVVAPDYGYFTAYDFALPWTRNRKVHDFLRWYGEQFAKGDPDQFIFAGHSNGTYLMGSALVKVPSMRFRRIYLAGSVLPRQFAWRKLLERRQVGHYALEGSTEVFKPGSVHNDRAELDVPVAVLASWLRGVGSNDVGTAGVDGFVDSPAGLVSEHELVLKGGHGAAFGLKPGQRDETRIDQIAAYLRSGQGDREPTTSPSPAFRWFSRFVGQRLVAWMLLLGIARLVTAGHRAVRARWGRVPARWSAAIAISTVIALLRSI